MIFVETLLSSAAALLIIGILISIASTSLYLLTRKRDTQPIDFLLGGILVEMGVLNANELEKALELRKETKPKMKIGLFLWSEKYCTKDQLHEAVVTQKWIRSRSVIRQAMGLSNLAIEKKKSSSGKIQRLDGLSS